MNAPIPTPSPNSEAGLERVVVWQRCAMADDADGARAMDFSRQVLAQVEVCGGEPLALLGSTVVFSFDAVDCDNALELALSLLAMAAERSPQPHVSYGIAIGKLTTRALNGGHALEGAALDRAQALASAAHDSGVAVDDTAHERLVEHYLFGEEVKAGIFRGRALDRSMPRKRTCRTAVRHLKQAPIPESRAMTFEALRAHATGAQERSILLRTNHPYEALDLLSRLAEEVTPPFQLHLRAQAAGLQPLGSLQAAFTHGPSQPRLQQALLALPLDDQQILRALIMGEAIARADVVGAMKTLLDRPGPAPWVVLHRLHDMDAASLGVLSECRKRLTRAPLVFAVLPEGSTAPAVLFPEDDRYEVTLGHLPLEERRAMATAILCLPENSAIAQRVTVISDPTPLGVVEGCRTLVAAGDLVEGDAGFRWRAGPRQAQAAIPVETLIGERVTGASPLAYRMLEVLAVMPPSGGKDLCLRIAELDGATTAEAEEGLRALQEEGFVADDSPDLGAWEGALRNAVLAMLPGPRYAELQRFVARALMQGGSVAQVTRGYGRALLAHHQAEGGLVQEATAALLDAGEEALRCGFQRMAVHLAATAIDLEPSADVRGRAQKLMASLEKGRRETPSAARTTADTPSVPPPPGTGISSHALSQAVECLRRGDLDAVERHLDAVTAAGGSRDAARRLRAMLLLHQNETERAMQALKQATGSEISPGEDPRDSLAVALIKLKDSDVPAAVRSALSALAASRAQRDTRGQQASLLVLSGCYSLAGDADAARRLQEAAMATVP